jgi:glycosyltransferase involved in cell wall biosynthesis
MTVAIVVPAYNEDKIIKRNILELLKYCQNSLGYDFKIVVSDNNSTDNTASIVRGLSDQHDDISYLLVEKKGKGAAVIGGWQSVKADVYCFMDADMAVDLNALSVLVASIKAGGDVSLGSRYSKNSKVNNYLSRKVVSRVYRVIAREFLKTHINDLSCGFKAVSARIRNEHLVGLGNHGWFFDSELAVTCERLGYRINEIPVNWREKRASKDQSRVSVATVTKEYVKELIGLRKKLKRMSHNNLRVCYFGIYNQQYSRNKILINGLRSNGVRVLECHSSLKGVSKFFDLIKKHWRIRKDYDVMVVGFPGQVAMILARFLTFRPIVLDAFLSFYDSMIYDRKMYAKKSLKAKYFWLIDFLSCHMSKRVLLDTSAHIMYFHKTFKIPIKKFNRILIGADEKVFYPVDTDRPVDQFRIHFHGTYIPLQGIKYIIEAADILRDENIVFTLVGGGQQKKVMEQLVIDLGLTETVKLVKFIPVEEVASYMANSDLVLGIFGDTAKTKRVIPNKVYEGLAMAKPVITARTRAIDEVFEDGKNIKLCEVASGPDLARAIMDIKNDDALRDSIAYNGYILYRRQFNSISLGEELKNILKELI